MRTDVIEEDDLMEIALNAGADDMDNTGEIYEITCDPQAYDQLKAALKEKEIPTEVAEISMIPQNTVPVSDNDTARKILSLMDDFEEHEDIQNVYANFNIPDEIINQFEA